MPEDTPRTHKSTAEPYRQPNKDVHADDVDEYVSRNQDLLARLLTSGVTEAQGYALAAILNGGNADDIEEIQQLLDEMKQERRG